MNLPILQRRIGESSYAFKQRQRAQADAAAFEAFVDAAEVEATQAGDPGQEDPRDIAADEAAKLGDPL